MNSQVDQFLTKARTWRTEMTLLREIVLECGLHEDFKWMHPCYSYQGNNVVLIHQFKEYCALLFFKGVLMNDPMGILIRQTENVQDRRQIRFKNTAEIGDLREVLKEYIQQAIAIEKSGQKVEYKKTAEFTMPAEFKHRLDGDESLKEAFEALTPGRQRGYLLFFSAARQSKTREARIERSVPKIRSGKGLDD